MTSRSNHFDLLRLVAAFMVLLAHCYPLYGIGKDAIAASNGWLRVSAHFGEWGVAIFFVISGYLITASYLRRGDWRDYAICRVLRIMPAYAVVIALSVLVLGPLVSRLSFVDYFTTSQTWEYLRGVFPFALHYALPGVFLENPYPLTVNGSLWTIPVEIAMYLLVGVLGVSGRLRISWCALCWAAMALLHLMLHYHESLHTFNPLA